MVTPSSCSYPMTSARSRRRTWRSACWTGTSGSRTVTRRTGRASTCRMASRASSCQVSGRWWRSELVSCSATDRSAWTRWGRTNERLDDGDLPHLRAVVLDRGPERAPTRRASGRARAHGARRGYKPPPELSVIVGLMAVAGSLLCIYVLTTLSDLFDLFGQGEFGRAFGALLGLVVAF